MDNILIPLTLPEIEEVQVLHLEPNDALVFYVQVPLSDKATARLHEQVSIWTRRAFGRKVEVLILEEGARMKVLRGPITPETVVVTEGVSK